MNPLAQGARAVPVALPAVVGPAEDELRGLDAAEVLERRQLFVSAGTLVSAGVGGLSVAWFEVFKWARRRRRKP